MTRNLQPALGKLTQVANQTLARFFTRAIFVFVLFVALGAGNGYVNAVAAPPQIETAAGGTLVITLDKALESGGTVTLDMVPAYTRDFPGCGFGVDLSPDHTKIIVSLPDGGCMPTSNMEVAIISAVKADGTVDAQYSLQAVDGSWEVLIQDL